MTHLGDAIRKARGKMSQTDFAKKLGVDQSYLSTLETGASSLRRKGDTAANHERRRALLSRIAELCDADLGLLMLAWAMDEGFFALTDKLHAQGQRLLADLLRGRRYPEWAWSAIRDILDRVKR